MCHTNWEENGELVPINCVCVRFGPNQKRFEQFIHHQMMRPNWAHYVLDNLPIAPVYIDECQCVQVQLVSVRIQHIWAAMFLLLRSLYLPLFDITLTGKQLRIHWIATVSFTWQHNGNTKCHFPPRFNQHIHNVKWHFTTFDKITKRNRWGKEQRCRRINGIENPTKIR